MNTIKVISISVLGGLLGLLAGFGIMGLQFRQAAAQVLNHGGGELVMVQQADSAGLPVNAAVGVGDDFVTQVYKKVSPAVVHITNRFQQYDLFFGPYEDEATGSGVIVNPQGYIL